MAPDPSERKRTKTTSFAEGDAWSTTVGGRSTPSTNSLVARPPAVVDGSAVTSILPGISDQEASAVISHFDGDVSAAVNWFIDRDAALADIPPYQERELHSTSGPSAEHGTSGLPAERSVTVATSRSDAIATSADATGEVLRGADRDIGPPAGWWGSDRECLDDEVVGGDAYALCPCCEQSFDDPGAAMVALLCGHYTCYECVEGANKGRLSRDAASGSAAVTSSDPAGISCPLCGKRGKIAIRTTPSCAWSAVHRS
jgi:hypothetical protein